MMTTPLDLRKHPEYRNGAQNRAMGHSKSQSGKAVDRSDYDGRQANHAGWDDMDIHLRMQDVLKSMKPA